MRFAVFAIAAAKKISALSLTSLKSLREMTRFLIFSLSYLARTTTTRPGSEIPPGLNSSAFTALKIAEFAPMASARVRIARHANPGARRSDRNAKRTSRLSVSIAGIPRWSRNSSFICSRPPKLRRAAFAAS